MEEFANKEKIKKIPESIEYDLGDYIAKITPSSHIIKDDNFNLETARGQVKILLRDAINSPKFELFDKVTGNLILDEEFRKEKKKYTETNKSTEVSKAFRHNTYNRIHNQVDAIFNFIDFLVSFNENINTENLEKWKENLERIKSKGFSDEQVKETDNLLLEIYNTI